MLYAAPISDMIAFFSGIYKLPAALYALSFIALFRIRCFSGPTTLRRRYCNSALCVTGKSTRNNANSGSNATLSNTIPNRRISYIMNLQNIVAGMVCYSGYSISTGSSSGYISEEDNSEEEIDPVTIRISSSLIASTTKCVPFSAILSPALIRFR